MTRGPEPDVGAWLNALGMSEYVAAFAENHIDAETLKQLTADDLRELGVSSIGHRRKLLAAIGELNAVPSSALELQRKPNIDADRQRSTTAQLRLVTTLFSDLVGFTSLSNRFDAEVLDDLLRKYAEVCTRIAARHDGHIVKFLGDGVLVTFGYPRARDDDAVRAVRMGLELVEMVGRIGIPGGGFLSARVGIATGNVVAGESAVERDSLVGDSPNLAARLQSEADPGQVLVAPSTAALIGTRFVCEKAGNRTLKGFADPIAAVRVLSEGRSESRFEATRRKSELPMAGRSAELARLMGRATLALSGQGQVVVIEGEAGIGKSRLVSEVAHQPEISSRQRFLLQTSPHDLGTPFYPVIKFIEYSAGLSASDGPDVRISKIAEMLRSRAHVPDDWLALIADMLGIDTAYSKFLVGFAAREIRLRTVRMLVELLVAIANHGALIVLEDMQWADPSTRELLSQFVSRAASIPALVLITLRPLTATDPQPSWMTAAHVTRLSIDKLAADELRTLIMNIMAPAAPANDIVAAIVARSDGVPIFAEELAYSLLEGVGKTTPRSSRSVNMDDSVNAIPSTLTESLLARLDRLAHGLETAQLAAVIGREIPLKLLIGISPLKEDAVRAAVEELIAVGILIRYETTFGEDVAFRQSLVRDSAYSLVLRRDRLRLHRQIAETVIAKLPEMAERRLDFVPRHLEASGDQQAAITAWRQAGGYAARQSAVGEAVAHFTRALNICLSQPENAARNEQELAILIELAFPMLAMRGWNSSEAASYVDRAVTLASQPHSKHRIVPVLMAKWLTGIGTADRKALRALAEQIATLASEGNDIDQLLAFRVLSSQCLFEGRLQDSLQHYRGFRALYDPERHEIELGSGATNHAVTIDAGLATCLALMDQPEEAKTLATAAIDAAYAGGHFNTICQTLAAAGGFCALLQRDADTLVRCAGELADFAQRHDLPFWQPHADLFAGLATVLRGNTTLGLAQAKKGIDAMIIGRAFVLSAWATFYAAACAEAGQSAEAYRALSAAQPIIEGGERWFEAEFLRVRAGLKQAAGEFDAARHDLNEALRLAKLQAATLFERRACLDLERQ